MDNLEILKDMLNDDNITEETELNTIGTWDSMAVVSFIAILDDSYNKTIRYDDIKGFKTVKDLMDVMN